MTGPAPLWWLAFTDPAGPRTRRCLGIAIVQAHTKVGAVIRINELGIDPGGEITDIGPIPTRMISPEWRDRLLTREQVWTIPVPDFW